MSPVREILLPRARLVPARLKTEQWPNDLDKICSYYLYSIFIRSSMKCNRILPYHLNKRKCQDYLTHLLFYLIFFFPQKRNNFASEYRGISCILNLHTNGRMREYGFQRSFSFSNIRRQFLGQDLTMNTQFNQVLSN